MTRTWRQVVFESTPRNDGAPGWMRPSRNSSAAPAAITGRLK
ncbi:MAG: hypothetical protein ACXWJN_08545 [Methyloceanibacter sp.]